MLRGEPVVGASDLRFKILVFNDDIVVLGKLLEFNNKVSRLHHIDDEYAEEKSYDKTECQIPCKPVNGTQYVRVNEKIIERSEYRPEEREQRADDTLYVSPHIAVVPKSDFKHLQAEDTRYVLDHGHKHRHRRKEHNLVENRI